MQKSTYVALFRKILPTLILATMCLVAVPQRALAQASAPPAPVPEQITAAKTVFIANGGADASLLSGLKIAGGRDAAYNQFYARMKTWGRYQLVPSPQQADLVFEIRCTDLPDFQGTWPELQLTILDAKTHFTLWRVTEAAAGSWKKSFAGAINVLIGDVKNIAPAPPAATN